MWTAIALICIAGVIGQAYRARHEGTRNQESREQLEQLNQRVERLDGELRERIEVLERIVTDRTEDLKRQFDHLDKAS
jgi:nitrate/nitrite-specific signal transduction histidine kinase